MTCRPFDIGNLAILIVLLSHCSARPSISARDVADANDTGGMRGGQNDDERALLAELPRLPSGKAQRIRAMSVVADAPYEAASGRRCRAVLVEGGEAPRSAKRLACSDGRSWFFVPDVFGSSAEE